MGLGSSDPRKNSRGGSRPARITWGSHSHGAAPSRKARPVIRTNRAEGEARRKVDRRI